MINYYHWVCVWVCLGSERRSATRRSLKGQIYIVGAKVFAELPSKFKKVPDLLRINPTNQNICLNLKTCFGLC